MKLNYQSLLTGDMVCCGAFGVFPSITRAVSRGIKYVFDRDTAVHTGMAVDWDGQKFILEMGAKGIELNPFTKYIESRLRWIILIRRPIPLTAEQRKKLLDDCVHDYRNSIEYDYKGLVSFVIKRVKENPSRKYCSEYYYSRLKEYMPFPNDYSVRVSPWDLQYCDNFENIDCL